LRIQSSHHYDARGVDAYFSPPEAVLSLLAIEATQLPKHIWEPAAGDGAIVEPLRAAGYRVTASDLLDYGLEGCESGVDYLEAAPRPGIEGVVTNPPYRLAMAFAKKAIAEAPYLALLLRTNFLESTARLPFFRRHPPARIWISSRRLPMMHRHGWQGPRAPSNTCFAWFVWQRGSSTRPVVDWFDWREHAASTDAPARFSEGTDDSG
jgi:hypothetical protein